MPVVAMPESQAVSWESVAMLVDGRAVVIRRGATILEAARELGIAIPTMCHCDGLPPFTSCMVCLVEEEESGRLLPSCSALASSGMSVLTDSPAVRAARRGALELLLSEHVGDCAGPCQDACPAGLDIPAMLRAVAAGDMAEATRVVHERIPLAAVLGRICSAPCEKACRRRLCDAPVAICLVKRRIGDTALDAGAVVGMELMPTASGNRVAVVGAGPAGLSAAWFLRRFGHGVTIFEAESAPGGGLRHGCAPERLPLSVLDREIARLSAAGEIDIQCSVRIGRERTFSSLRDEFDAIVLAAGSRCGEVAGFSGLSLDHEWFVADRHTGATSLPGVFAVGDLLRDTGHMAARAVGDGRHAAIAADQFLRGLAVVGVPRRFHSRMGAVGSEAERAEMMKGASSASRATGSAEGGGFTGAEAVGEALRCLHCDCRKPFSCKLREYAEEYGASARHYAPGERVAFSRNLTHPDLVHEPGKCIRCGLCVRISRAHGAGVGMAFLGRGDGVQISPPLNEPLSEALAGAATECVEACPTGALSWR
jgi:ferredoxin